MVETCTKKIFGIFTIHHHNWGPWTLTREHEPIYYKGSKIQDDSTYKLHRIITRQCLNCPESQTIKDPDTHLTM